MNNDALMWCWGSGFALLMCLVLAMRLVDLFEDLVSDRVLRVLAVVVGGGGVLVVLGWIWLVVITLRSA